MRIKETKNSIHTERGVAIPTALLLVLFISAISALFSTLATGNLRQINISNAVQDTFNSAEGGSHEVMREMAISPELWRELNVLASLPNSYTEYSPQNFLSTNGIPSCSGIACHRQMYPTGGGLIKNFGPLGGDGDTVDTTALIVEQLDPDSPPTQDLTLNNQSVWMQVERLDEKNPDAGSLGGSLDNNNSGGTSAGVTRFRITATTYRTVRGERGLATLVYVVELPST